MQADVARAALALHLGIPVLPHYEESPTPRCPEGDSCRHRWALEESGRHTLQCAIPTSRHNAVRDTLYSLVLPVALPGSAGREQGLGRHNVPPPDGVIGVHPDLYRPGDVVYRPALQQSCRLSMIDVTIAGVHQEDTKLYGWPGERKSSRKPASNSAIGEVPGSPAGVMGCTLCPSASRSMEPSVHQPQQKSNDLVRHTAPWVWNS